jgi:hypothetical protein
MQFFLMENREMPWGDWGEVLWAGLTPWDESKNTFHIERTGPFAPKAYFSNKILIFSEEVKELLESSGLKGIKFTCKAELAKVVDLDWSSWDGNKGITNYLDDLFEPEDIITNGENSPAIAERMPNYWFTTTPTTIHIFTDRASKHGSPFDLIYIDGTPDSGADFLAGIERTGCFVSLKAKLWLQSNCPSCFSFHPISIRN